MKSSVLKNVGRFFIILLVMSGAGTCMALRTLTLVNVWIVTIAAVIAALPVAMLISRKDRALVTLPYRHLNTLIWLAAVATVFAGTFYAANYAGANEGRSSATEAVVERKYHEVRHRTKRVGRRYIRSDETYNEYYADMQLKGGHIVTIHLSRSQVNRIRQGETLEVSVAPGLFGVPVVIRKSIFKQHNKL